MKVKPTNLAPLFNAEIRRVASAENKTDEKSMHSFMQEIAVLCGLTQTRMVFHWRSGRHPLPAQHVPVLCQRFKSNVLLDALKSADVAIEIPDDVNLALEANRSLRQDLKFHERILLHFADGRITPGELLELRELEARAHQHLHLMIGYAEADCLRRLSGGVSRKESITARTSKLSQRSEVRKTGTR